MIVLVCLLFLVVMASGVNQDIVPEGYNKAFRPRQAEEVPLEIYFSMKINGIQEVNFEKMTVKIHMYLRVSWIDERLLFPYEAFNRTVDQHDPISLQSDLLDQIWRPDHFFRLIHNIEEFELLQKFMGVKLSPTKKILTSSMHVLEFGCPMNFRDYPFDTQVCHILIGSYFYTLSELTFHWDELGLTIDEVVGQQLADYEFQLIRYNSTICDCQGCFPDKTPCIRLALTLKRHYLVYLLGFFIPSSLFVMVAWTSFFWPAEVIPGRTVLVITSLLTVSSLYSTSRADSPKTSYVKALDTWMFFSIISGVLTLFQYAIVLQWTKRKKSAMNTKIQPSTSSFDMREKEVLRYETYQRRTERVGQIGLPIIFLLFNLCYWPFYT